MSLSGGVGCLKTGLNTGRGAGDGGGCEGDGGIGDGGGGDGGIGDGGGGEGEGDGEGGGDAGSGRVLCNTTSAESAVVFRTRTTRLSRIQSSPALRVASNIVGE